MHTPLLRRPVDDAALEQIFLKARTYQKFLDRPLDDAVLRELLDVAKWGPTSVNSQPARFVFVRSPEGKQRLKPSLAPLNVAKTMAAPVTAIVAYDTRFFEFMSQQVPHNPAAGEMFAKNTSLAEETAFRNSSLQGAYLILAARAIGLDAGPMSGFDGATLNKEFFPDGRWRANFLINLGWGAADGVHPQGPRMAYDDVAQVI